MKKSALAAAVAAAVLSSGAYTTCPAVLTITDVQLVAGGFDMEVPCPSGSTPFTISIISAGTMQMAGNLCLDPSGIGVPFIRLDINAVTGTFVGSGTTFSSGSIDIDVQTTSGWILYNTVSVSTTNLDCTNGGTGLNGAGIAGLQVVGGTIVAPGIWNGLSPDPTEALAICETTLFGQPAWLFIN
jgi:hypothetical protein